MRDRGVGLFCTAALAAALAVVSCGRKSGSKIVETSTENHAAESAASVVATSSSAESSSAAAGSSAVATKKRALISAKVEIYQKDNVSIGYPVVNDLMDSAQQEKLNARLKKDALSPIGALLVDAAEDKLTVMAEIVSANTDRVVVMYHGEVQRSGDAAPVKLFYTNTVMVKALEDLGLRDAVDADSIVSYALGDAFELDNTSESKVNAYRAWVRSTGKEALQKPLEEKLAASDFPLKKGENDKFQWPESSNYVKSGRIYFSIPVPQGTGSVVVMKYDMMTR